MGIDGDWNGVPQPFFYLILNAGFFPLYQWVVAGSPRPLLRGFTPFGSPPHRRPGPVGCFLVCWAVGALVGLDTYMAVVPAAVVSVGEARHGAPPGGGFDGCAPIPPDQEG